jgi:hypothetical protein
MTNNNQEIVQESLNIIHNKMETLRSIAQASPELSEAKVNLRFSQLSSVLEDIDFLFDPRY